MKPVEITTARFWEIAQAVLLKRGQIILDTTKPSGDRLVVLDVEGRVHAFCYPNHKTYMEIKS